MTEAMGLLEPLIETPWQVEHSRSLQGHACAVMDTAASRRVAASADVDGHVTTWDATGNFEKVMCWRCFYAVRSQLALNCKRRNVTRNCVNKCICASPPGMSRATFER